LDFQIPFQRYTQQYKIKYLALYQAIKDAITSGQLAFQMKLPSSRELSALYLISRGTVNQVYEMLAAEGYVTTTIGSGTFVAFQLQEVEKNVDQSVKFKLSNWGEALQSDTLRSAKHKEEVRVNFAIGIPELATFPHELWSRYMYAEVRELVNSTQKEAFMPQGHLPLREAISRYLLRARGIQAEAEDIVILNGSMQAIALLSQLLIDPGEAVVVEYPGFHGFRRAINASRGIIIDAKIDHLGIQVADWNARLLFVTPSRQFPTGAVLSLERRQELLKWASRRGAIVIEDDYDSEFRHHGRPIEPLKILDTHGRVVYIGTFTKTMHPDLRLGYAVIPLGLRSSFLKAKQLFEPHPTSILEQRALAAFMNTGQYERHLRRMKRIYSRRYERMYAEMCNMLADLFEFVPSDAGLHLFAWWKRSFKEWEYYKEACRQAGVVWTDGDVYYTEQEQRASACFGFSHLQEDKIQAGIEMMREVWDAGI
jgi:GntR family transcriptional regulator/MocR family aminotransferase